MATTPTAPTLEMTVPTVGDAVDVALDGTMAYLADPPATLSIIDLRAP
ncbi:MAG: hypothetical protein ACRDGN_12370 [bacterium]